MPGKKHVIADTVSRLHECRQIDHLESLVNDWYECHHKVENYFASVSLANHMSFATLASIIDRVLEWRQQKAS